MHKLLISCVLLMSTVVPSVSAGTVNRAKKHRKAASEQTRKSVSAPSTGSSAVLQVSSSSTEAGALFASGVDSWEKLQTDQALLRWRQAVAKDRSFALAHLMLSYVSTDPVEQLTESNAATLLSPHVTPGEQLLIGWFSGAKQGNYVPAIAAMNDLLQQFPQDKHIALWAGSWLLNQGQYEPAIKRLEQAVKLDTNYAAALNDLGYAYAYQSNYSNALAAMEKYTALLPREPNPQDSYAEILRMSGKYEEAQDHYGIALSIDPKFHSSQLGIADTYSLMGQEKKAREEYVKAQALATDKTTELTDELQSAFTYVRDQDFLGADEALLTVAKQAHRSNLPLLEAQALRMRGTIQVIHTPDSLTTTEEGHSRRRLLFSSKKPTKRPENDYFEQAEQLLSEAKAITESDRQNETAQLLRARTEAAAKLSLFDEAQNYLAQLQSLALHSRSTLVQSAADGAQGAVLVYQNKWNEATEYLQRDSQNAFSLFRLAVAYRNSGDLQATQQQESLLTGFNQPTLEQAFVLPTVRARILASQTKAQTISHR